MAAAKPPRATVVVPLVARPLVTWITSTPASAHSNAAMVPAAPPPMIRTSVSYLTIGMFSRIWLVLGASDGGDLDECVDAGIGKGVVIDVQRQLLEFCGLQV